MKVDYDGAILNEFAARLYNQARTIVASYTIAGAILGALVGAVVALALRRQDLSVTYAGIVAVVFGAIGYSRGREKAFALRLQAQTALCQVQIEVNTRSR